MISTISNFESEEKRENKSIWPVEVSWHSWYNSATLWPNFYSQRSSPSFRRLLEGNKEDRGRREKGGRIYILENAQQISRLLCLRFKYKTSLLLTLDKIIGIIILISLYKMYNEIEVTKLLSSIQRVFGEIGLLFRLSLFLASSIFYLKYISLIKY